MKAMETLQDLIEEAKIRTVWWALCVFLVTYFLSHTSPSMWMNLPIAIFIVCALRIFSNEVEFTWKVHQSGLSQSYLSYLEKKQLSVNDSRISSAPPPPRWKRKIDSPIVEAAINDFIDKILKDFVVDLWYKEITPDREAPELIHAVIMDAIGEISVRAKDINLVDLLTRDIVDLIGDHLELFRRNQVAIGVDVMGTLSTEERDERLKHHLMASKELHPALISPESEYKVLQCLIGGVLAIVLRPREAQCPLVRTIAREIVTCMVMQPVMNLASPGYVNEVIELLLLAIKDDILVGGDQSGDSTSSKCSFLNNHKTDILENKGNYQDTDMALAKTDNSHQEEPVQPHHGDWGRMLEAATQRRTEVLTPENLENLWTKGRNYKKKENKIAKVGFQQPLAKDSAIPRGSRKEMSTKSTLVSTGMDDKAAAQKTSHLIDENGNGRLLGQDHSDDLSFDRLHIHDELDVSCNRSVNEVKHRHKRCNSTSALKAESDRKQEFSGVGDGPIISEFYSTEFGWHREDHAVKKVSDMVVHSDESHVPKLRSRVMGAYFEKLGSKSFAVYSIAVTDAENRTWFVKRRYRNFERLHRHLKDIPNYTLHLPPKRIFTSSTDDAFVHQRCLQLDKYLQDLLSMANVAEQHEVWDFLSVSSKNYSYGKSSSMMRTLAVNVDDAVDDIVRQFRGVSDGLMRKVVGSPSPLDESKLSIYTRTLSWHAGEINKHVSRHDAMETGNSSSDNEESHEQEKCGQEEIGWHSDDESNSKESPPLFDQESRTLSSDKKLDVEIKSESINQGGFTLATSAVTSSHIEEVPPEWTPPNVSVPLLNLVDKVFQLKRRGWLRRQVFWISKQILQLIMEDAIDDWLLRQIYLLRREDTVALGIRWAQDILWPGGTFITKLGIPKGKDDDGQQNMTLQMDQFRGSKGSKQVSFEEQLEAARRVSDIKKMLFDGAPTALVSLIGNKQYKRCARDIFYFTQSTICVKQLAYGILELLLLTVFPELRDLFLDLHEKMCVPPAK